MMIRNCRVLKQSEIDALAKSLDTILNGWCKDWLPSDFTANVEDVKALTAKEEKCDEIEAEYLAAWSNDSWCAVLSGGSDIQPVGKILLGRSPETMEADTPIGPTIQSIVDDALLELIQRVVAGGNISIDAVPVKLSKETSVPKDAFHPWSGATVVRVSVMGCEMGLMLSGSVIENIIPRQTTDVSRIAIERDHVLKGIKDKKVKAQVRLKSTKLSIGTLTNLSPGDVVVLEHEVDCPFNLIISNADNYCKGYLGMSDGRYALKLDSIEPYTN